MEVTIGTIYRMADAASEDEKRQIREKAQEALAREIYKEVLVSISKIELAVLAGEDEEAILLLFELKSSLNN